MVRILYPLSIRLVSQFEQLKRLHCPFRVLVIVDIPPDIAEGQFYMVDFVKMTLELKEVFIISGKGYFIYYFRMV